ncbi:MAG: SDR family oxidoreductase [Rhodothermales bacterium]
MKLNGKTAIVTGASAGLGEEISRQLVKAGATVYGLARREDKLDDVRHELGTAFVPVSGDVRKESDIRHLVERILAETHRIDVLVNNAGFGIFKPLTRVSAREWSTLHDTNLKGVFLCSKAVIPVMQQQNEKSGFGGHIVNIASIAGLVGNPEIGVYNASKFGVRGLSESMMKEVRGDGIKVTCVFPGSIDTDFSATVGSGRSRKGMDAKDVAGSVLHVLRGPDNYLVSELTMRPLRVQ